MFENIDLDKLFERFGNQKVVIVGDVMIDAYMWGKVKRISPEAPVPVVSEIKEEKRLGGAANVALNIKAMGAVPILCSVIGDDARGKQFLELMNKRNLTDIGLIVDKKRVTTHKTRIISGNQHLLRVDEETEEEISTATTKKLSSFLKDILEDGNIGSIIIQDYDKGVVTPKLIKEIKKLSDQKKVPVLVDPKKRNFMHYEGINFFKPNFKELKEGLKADVDKNELEDVAGLMQKLRINRSHDTVMVTLSEMGVIINNGDEYNHIAAEVRDIADVSGAGDTVISVAALCVGEKMNPLDIAGLSNLAGGQVCEKTGVVSVNFYQLLEEAKQIQGEE